MNHILGTPENPIDHVLLGNIISLIGRQVHDKYLSFLNMGSPMFIPVWNSVDNRHSFIQVFFLSKEGVNFSHDGAMALYNGIKEDVLNTRTPYVSEKNGSWVEYATGLTAHNLSDIKSIPSKYRDSNWSSFVARIGGCWLMSNTPTVTIHRNSKLSDYYHNISYSKTPRILEDIFGPEVTAGALVRFTIVSSDLRFVEFAQKENYNYV